MDKPKCKDMKDKCFARTGRYCNILRCSISAPCPFKKVNKEWTKGKHYPNTYKEN